MLVKDKRGFIDMDINWQAFVILCTVGAIAIGFHFVILKGMEFQEPLWIKTLAVVAIPVASYIFTKMWFD